MRPPSNNRPPKASVYAVITHCRLVSERPSCACAEGSALFMTGACRTRPPATSATLGSAFGSRLAGGRDLVDVFLGPLGDGLDRGLQRPPEGRQRVLHARRHLGEDAPGHQAVTGHPPQGLGEDL